MGRWVHFDDLKTKLVSYFTQDFNGFRKSETLSTHRQKNTIYVGMNEVDLNLELGCCNVCNVGDRLLLEGIITFH